MSAGWDLASKVTSPEYSIYVFFFSAFFSVGCEASLFSPHRPVRYSLQYNKPVTFTISNFALVNELIAVTFERNEHFVSMPDLLSSIAWRTTLTLPLNFLAVEGVGLGEELSRELPDENDIKVFLVSSNTAVYRFWVYAYLARVTSNIKQKMALKLTNTNTDRSDIFFC